MGVTWPACESDDAFIEKAGLVASFSLLGKKGPLGPERK